MLCFITALTMIMPINRINPVEVTIGEHIFHILIMHFQENLSLAQNEPHA